MQVGDRHEFFAMKDGRKSHGEYVLPSYFLSQRPDVIEDKELPLAGVVLCFTSILPEQRVRLAHLL